jgi:hypothetical protein
MTENTEKEFDPSAEEAAKALEAITSGEVQEAIHPDGLEMQEWVFTNDKTNPAPRQLFHMLHDGAFKNRLGIMHCKVRDKDEIHTLIVGVEVNEQGAFAFPIAKLLTQEEQGNYLAPDGNGNFVGI